VPFLRLLLNTITFRPQTYFWGSFRSQKTHLLSKVIQMNQLDSTMIY